MRVVGRENTTMFPFRQIAFPVDFSEDCTAAVPYVHEMAKHFDASLLVLHAFDTPVWLDVGQYPDAVRQRLLEEERLQEFTRENFPGVRAEALLVKGEPVSAIAHTLNARKTDLIMLPTHGRGLVRRFLIGSIAAKLLHDLDCPIWTGVHAALVSHQPSLPYKSLVCAVDLNDEAPATMKSAAAFAEQYQARLTLLHVVNLLPPLFEIDVAPIRSQILNAADLRLRELRNEAGIKADIAILDGSIPCRIRTEVANLQADLVIAGRGHARNRISRLGSSLYQIVRESPCPVLSF